MKMLILNLVLVLSASTLAHETPDFLDQFRNNKYEIVDTLFKKYGKGNGFVPNLGVVAPMSNGVNRLHFVKINHLCINGDKVQTITPIKSCLSYGYPEKECKEDKRRRERGLPPRVNGPTCYDKTKPKVCEAYEAVTAVGAIESEKPRCVKKHEQAYREWVKALKKKYWSQSKKYEKELRKWKQDYPNCTIETTFTSKLRTEFNFDIVKNVKKKDSFGRTNDDYDHNVKGQLIMNVDVELPQCM